MGGNCGTQACCGNEGKGNEINMSNNYKENMKEKAKLYNP
jgi:hypothetical protein